MTVTVLAPAKINLTLDIIGKRSDGFHDVEMVMQSVGVYDTLRLWRLSSLEADELWESAGESAVIYSGSGEVKTLLRLTMDVPGLACDETNLAWRAAKLFFDNYGDMPNEGKVPVGKHNCRAIAIDITKRIPMAAGLAGGSADAAGVLRGLKMLYDADIPLTELADISGGLGSDIPFCVIGGTMLATGRGEVLEGLPSMRPCYVVLAKPPVDISTPWAYRSFDDFAEKTPDFDRPDTYGLIRCLSEGGSLEEILGFIGNVFENVTIPACPLIEEYKQLMMDNGAMAALMSGSGPTVFGIVSDEAEAERLAAVMQEKTDGQVAFGPIIEDLM